MQKFTDLKIQAFEPNVDAYNKFLKTISKNSFKNIEISNFGLSNSNKNYQGQYNNKTGGLYSENIPKEKSVFLENVSLMKDYFTLFY